MISFLHRGKEEGIRLWTLGMVSSDLRQIISFFKIAVFTRPTRVLRPVYEIKGCYIGIAIGLGLVKQIWKFLEFLEDQMKSKDPEFDSN